LKKKILIICKAFYPEISPRSFRATELAKEFARQGHSVTVLMPRQGRNYSEFENTYNVTIKDLGRLRFKNIALKGQGATLLFRRAVRRVLNLIFEYPDIELMFKVTSALKKENGYDLLISIAVPHPIHWGVAKVWNKKISKIWVADCGDPFMFARLDTFKKLFYFKYFEKSFCRKCNFITIPVEGAMKAYYPEFHHKIRVIPQGFKFDDIDLAPFQKTHDFPQFAYAGSFIPGKRDPRPFLDFLCRLNRDFKFHIYTSHKSFIIPYKEILKDKINILDYVPRENLIKHLSTMDFLVNFDNNTNEQIPSKLIDYLISGRPILNITRDFDKNIIMEFFEGNYRNSLKIENPDQYRIENVCNSFIKLLDESFY